MPNITKGKPSMLIKEQIYRLEAKLLNLSIRQSEQKLSKIISDDFIEFGSLGEIYNKKDILKYLPIENTRSFEVSHFDITILAENVVLATYRVSENSIDSLRSSIWKQSQNGWQMIFHQGTICEKSKKEGVEYVD